MDCPQCHEKGVIVEKINEDIKRLKCSKCGLNEVRDARNLPLLAEVPGVDSKRTLTS